MEGGDGGERRVRLPHPTDLRLTLGPLRRGSADPCMRFVAGEVWRATRSAIGPATVHLRLDAPTATLYARAWGPGAAAVLDGVPALVGALDDNRGFAPTHPLLAELHERLPGLRIPRSGAVLEALVPTILEQRVTGGEARRSYRALVQCWGEPAPGAAGRALGLLVPPDPATLAGLPAWGLHRFGVERTRADTIRRACRHRRRLEETSAMGTGDASRRLQAIPGIGAWSAAEVGLVALGDADALSVGDYHLPHQVAWALTGQPRGSDALMVELLEPYRPHRGRVQRLLVAGGIGAPRFGPRRRATPWKTW